MLPSPATAMSVGWVSRAWMAGPPSPELPLLPVGPPVPAIVSILPSAVTRRTRVPSVMRMSPFLSIATPCGEDSSALVAFPLLLPVNPSFFGPVPATTVMAPSRPILKT